MAIPTIKLTPKLFGELIARSVGEMLGTLEGLPQREYDAALNGSIDGPLPELVDACLMGIVAGCRVQSIDFRVRGAGRQVIRGESFLPIAAEIAALIGDKLIGDTVIWALSAFWRNAMRESEAMTKVVLASPRRYARIWPEVEVPSWDPYAIISPDLLPLVRITHIAFHRVHLLELIAASKPTGHYFPKRGNDPKPAAREREIISMIERGLSDRDIAARLRVSRSSVLRCRRKSVSR